MRISVLLALVTALCGCTIYQEQQHRSRLQTAGDDDRYCQKQGFHYPQDRYISCRLKLYDERRRTRFMQMQMMNRASASPGGVPGMMPERPYTPVAPEHFQCHEAGEGGATYILCTETDRTVPE